jgi:hypothetical protein
VVAAMFGLAILVHFVPKLYRCVRRRRHKKAEVAIEMEGEITKTQQTVEIT